MRFVLVLAAACALGLASVAWAGDYHVGSTLVCSDCHVAHYSQQHALTSGGTFTPLGAGGPFEDLLRNEPNSLCLACHDGNSIAPDVFGDNAGKYQGTNRRAGALNSGSVLKANPTGYDEIDGHTLWSNATAPGGTFSHAGDGLECVDCHAQHGSASQYRNLLNRGIFTGKTLTYVPGGANIASKDIFEHNVRAYSDADVDYNEPDVTKSAYGNWCASCHTEFHGSGGAANMGGISGGTGVTSNANPWVRHPTADVNIGNNPATTYISSLTQFNSHTNRVKVMDSQGLWNGTSTDNTVTPSCFSCHEH